MRKLVKLALLCTALVVAACSGTDESGNAGQTVTVDSGDTACDLNSDEAAAGTVSFAITNTGSQVTEFYLYDEDSTTIVSEAENIGPGTSRDIAVELSAGTYVAACKPGMTGDGIRSSFTVDG